MLPRGACDQTHVRPWAVGARSRFFSRVMPRPAFAAGSRILALSPRNRIPPSLAPSGRCAVVGWVSRTCGVLCVARSRNPRGKGYAIGDGTEVRPETPSSTRDQTRTETTGFGTRDQQRNPSPKQSPETPLGAGPHRYRSFSRRHRRTVPVSRWRGQGQKAPGRGAGSDPLVLLLLILRAEKLQLPPAKLVGRIYAPSPAPSHASPSGERCVGGEEVGPVR